MSNSPEINIVVARVKDSLVVAYVSAFVLLALLMWCSSGTLSGYAVSMDQPVEVGRCNYLGNMDHPHFMAPFKAISGAPQSEWQSTIYLRRVAYPLFVFPFVTFFGTLRGGLIFNFLFTASAIAFFIEVMRARMGGQAAKRALWMLCTYPGITYWGGLPYCQASIVPVSLLSFCVVAQAARLDQKLVSALLGGALIGLLSSFYDVAVFFGPAYLFALALYRRWRALPLAMFGVAAGLFVPLLLVCQLFRISVANENTAIYGVVISSYLNNFSFTVLWSQAIKAITEFPQIFLASNFYVLPLATVLTTPLLFWKRRSDSETGSLTICPLLTAAGMLLLAGLALFLFTHLAPPYEGWQMRGTWIARIYQPIFPALVVLTVYALEIWRPLFKSIALSTLLIPSILISLTPLLGLEQLYFTFHNFYQHGSIDSIGRNIEKYGRRPLGFCRLT